jgi:APA family basic amino acid/polyamine antiporter
MPKLKRALGLFEASVYGIGIILGAGIYVLIGEAASIAGNSLWMAFIFTALIASFTGLSYAELSSMFPKSAAEYVYMKKAFRNKYFPFVLSSLIIFTEVFAGATVALGFGGYLQNFLAEFVEIPVILLAMLLVFFLSLLNFYGIKESARFNVIFTIVEILGLVFIIYLGLGYIGSIDYLEMPQGFGGIFSAAALIFFAYLGFEEMANIAEETKNARKNIPRAIIISLIVTTVLYVLVAISAVSILPWQVLGESAAPLADVAGAAMPGSSSLLSFIALFATLNTVLIILVVTSRMLYGMTKDTHLFRSLSLVHKKRRTPWLAVIVTMFLVMALTLIGNIKTVAFVADMGAFTIFLVVNVSLIWLRYKKPDLERPFRVPFNIGWFPILPAMGVLTCIFMMLHIEWYIVLVTLFILLIGFVTFYTFDKVKKRSSRVSR